MPAQITSIKEMQQVSARLRAGGRHIAFVPTMGALHEGHVSLIRRARTAGDAVVASVFVNPTQFGKGEDFERYPRALEDDARKAMGAGAEYVFAPSAADMYPPEYLTSVQVERITDLLEGRVRPGHFRGVTTIVAKLLNIVMPHVVLFGQKDAQQVVVIRRMIRDLNYPIELVVVPTVRETDGLAMSSRNAFLSEVERAQAPVLYRSLLLAQHRAEQGMRDPLVLKDEMRALIHSSSAGVIDYISIAESDTLEEVSVIPPGASVLVSLAVRFGRTRLIDNLVLRA